MAAGDSEVAGPSTRSHPVQDQVVPTPSSVSSARPHPQPDQTSQPQIQSRAASTMPPQQAAAPFSQPSMGPLPAAYNPKAYPVAMPQPAPYPMYGPPGAFPPAGRPQSTGWVYVRIGTYVAALISALIVLGLSGAFVADGASQGRAYVAVIMLPVSIVAIGWNLSEIITVLVRNGGVRLGPNPKRGIHPGAHVGLHLLLWLGWLITTLSALSLARSDQMCANPDNSGWSCGYTKSELASVRKTLPQSWALAVFSAISLVIHFSLFVGACVETNQLNKRTKVVYVPGPPPPQQNMILQPYPPWQQPQPSGFSQGPQPGFQQPQPVYGPPMTHHDPASGYYAPAAPQAAGPSQTQPSQGQPPLGGYYAPNGGSNTAA